MSDAAVLERPVRCKEATTLSEHIVEIISEQELADLKAQQPLSSTGGSSSGSSSGATPASSSSSRVPLPPMEPLPASSSAAPAAPVSNGVVTTPVR